MNFAQTDIDSLAAKLDAADLTEGEQAVVAHLLEAAEGEVSGFASFNFAPLGLKLGPPTEHAKLGPGQNSNKVIEYQDGDDFRQK